jgi:hypothetical protein
MHSKCLVPQVSPPLGRALVLHATKMPKIVVLRSFRPNGFIGRHYVRFAGRSVWLTTLSVLACQQRTGAWLTSRTTINLRNFGNRSFSCGITR